MFAWFRMKTAIHTDERIRTMNEILSGMRVIKMYTWEKPLAHLIDYCRRYSFNMFLNIIQGCKGNWHFLLIPTRKEVGIIRQTNYFRSLNTSLFNVSSKFIVFLTFLVYVISGNVLTSEKVFILMENFIQLHSSFFY